MPLCLFWLGTQPPEEVAAAKDKPLPSLHSPYFIPEPEPEPTIETGVKAMTSAVLGLLKQGK